MLAQNSSPDVPTQQQQQQEVHYILAEGRKEML